MVGVAVALLVLVGAAFVLLQDPDRYREEVAALLSDAAGHPVTLDGPLELSWRPSPTLSVTGVGVQAPSAQVRLDSVQVRLEPGALLARRFRAREVRVDGVVIDLASSPQPADAVAVPDPRGVPVDLLQIDGITVRRDGETVFRIINAAIREPDSPRGARVDLVLPVPGGEVRGRLRLRVTGSTLVLDDLDLNTPAGPVEGSLNVDLAATPVRIEGQLSADAVALTTPAAPTGRVFPDRTLNLSPLRTVDASLRLRVGRLSVNSVRLSDATLPLTLAGGRLGSTASATFAGGVVNATFAVDAVDSDWTLDLKLTAADAGDALGMFGLTSTERGGRLNLTAGLRATGTDTRSLIASLSGAVNVDAAQLHVRAGVARLAASDVLATLTRMLRGAGGERITVECAVARFSVRDGVARADDTLGVQTRTTNVMGSGQVSLPEERMELVFRPWPREGIGLSASTLVGAVGVTGPLLDPQVGLTSEGALQGGASAGAAVLTGGLSLIAQGLLDRARGDAPCQQAAGKAVASGARGSGVAGPLDRAVGGVGNAVKGIGRTLEGLLGGPGGRSAPAAGRSEQ